MDVAQQGSDVVVDLSRLYIFDLFPELVHPLPHLLWSEDKVLLDKQLGGALRLLVEPLGEPGVGVDDISSEDDHLLGFAHDLGCLLCVHLSLATTVLP